MPSTPSSRLSPDQFFSIVNHVLVEAGRDSLAINSPSRHVAEVRSTDRVLQILAGPGSGKTEMLVWRVLFELFVLETSPHEVIVTTFTRRAATELQVRLVERSEAFCRLALLHQIPVTDPRVHDLRVGTIHSLCDQLLAEFDPGYVEAGTQLVDENEIVIRIAREHRFLFGLGPGQLGDRLLRHPSLVALFRAPWESNSNWPSTLMERTECLLGMIAQITETWIPRCAASNRPNGLQGEFGPATLTADLRQLQSLWETSLNQNMILDFATIQKRFLDRQSQFQGRFKHILVDEFQDSNPIQFAIHTAWLESASTRLTVVGDDDQAIYRFRGSDLACFQGIEPHCLDRGIAYRQETLGVNYRSTRTIVEFSQAFKSRTPLSDLSMPKTVTSAPQAQPGLPVRLITGPWPQLSEVVATELAVLGAGQVPVPGGQSPKTAAVLMFSTSEKSSDRNGWSSPALAMREAIERRGMRVSNPRNKMAGTATSPVGQLLALISYLIDPVSKAPVGKNNRRIEVWASSDDDAKRHAAISHPPAFRINEYHAALQKNFQKDTGGQVGQVAVDRRPIIAYVDRVRQNLAALPSEQSGRLTLAGFVARLLSQDFFRNCGFSVRLFREAFFTQLLEANIAPTRLTARSLDQPLQTSLINGKYQWSDQMWSLLNVFGAFLEDNRLDDPEVEAFEEDAVLLLTFHQAKGLEFDHVYVAGSGREPDVNPALRTRLFSGDAIPCTLSAGALTTEDDHVLRLAKADRDREVYVALTRAKERLTLLQDTSNPRFYMVANPALAGMYGHSQSDAHVTSPTARVQEWRHA